MRLIMRKVRNEEGTKAEIAKVPTIHQVEVNINQKAMTRKIITTRNLLTKTRIMQMKTKNMVAKTLTTNRNHTEVAPRNTKRNHEAVEKTEEDMAEGTTEALTEDLTVADTIDMIEDQIEEAAEEATKRRGS